MGWYRSGVPQNAIITVGAEASNVINVAIQLKDRGNADLKVVGHVNAYLSDDATGDSLVATAPTSVAIGTDGTLHTVTTGKYWHLWSETDGDIDLNITLSTGADTFYLVVVLPSGKRVISGAITFAA